MYIHLFFFVYAIKGVSVLNINIKSDVVIDKN